MKLLIQSLFMLSFIGCLAACASTQKWSSAGGNREEGVVRVAYEYPERTVELHFFRCDLNGQPQPLLGQEIRWVASTELRTLDFPPADEELIQLLAR